MKGFSDKDDGIMGGFIFKIVWKILLRINVYVIKGFGDIMKALIDKMVFFGKEVILWFWWKLYKKGLIDKYGSISKIWLVKMVGRKFLLIKKLWLWKFSLIKTVVLGKGLANNNDSRKYFITKNVISMIKRAMWKL